MLAVAQNDYGYLLAVAATLCCYPGVIDTVLAAAVAGAARSSSNLPAANRATPAGERVGA